MHVIPDLISEFAVLAVNVVVERAPVGQDLGDHS